MPNTKPPMHPSVERIVTQGRLNKHAMVIATPTGHRFASYSTGIQRYERVCVELDAVLEEPGPRVAFYNATVRGVRVAKGKRGFATRMNVLAAIEREAIRQGIMDADGNLIEQEAADAPQA